ncbi:hypothetical protein, partial [Elizabethkingia anophelis]
EDLPFTREKMVSQYHREKQEKLKANEARDYIKEREKENKALFKISTLPTTIITVESKVSKTPEVGQKENSFLEIYSGRKR